jgi:hypothetical protein
LSLEAKEYLGSDREVINFVNKIEPSALLEVSNKLEPEPA